MRPALEVEDLTFGFHPGRPVLRGVSFCVWEGECLGIIGANGAGKSTLLWCLLGLLRERGGVRIFGEKAGKNHWRRIGFVFQNPEDQLFMPKLIEDITLPLVNRGVPAGVAGERALAALETMGLREAALRPAGELSLGQRKRAAIAAALAASPDLLILDEPTSELDGRSVRQLIQALASLTITRVIASHDLGLLRNLASRVLVLSEGRIIAEGASGEVLANEALLSRAGLI